MISFFITQTALNYDTSRLAMCDCQVHEKVTAAEHGSCISLAARNSLLDDAQQVKFIFYTYLYIYKRIYKAPLGHNSRGAIYFQRWPKPFPVLIAPTHGGWPG